MATNAEGYVCTGGQVHNNRQGAALPSHGVLCLFTMSRVGSIAKKGGKTKKTD
jgi:hypothetical protein